MEKRNITARGWRTVAAKLAMSATLVASAGWAWEAVSAILRGSSWS